MQHHQEWGGVWWATFLVTYRCRLRLQHGAARWMRSPAARPRGCAQRATEGVVLEHASMVNVGRGRQAAEGTETPRGRRGGGSPWMMVMRRWSPRMMVARHAEARSESTDNGGGAGRAQGKILAA
jgi:hypothetical protein